MINLNDKMLKLDKSRFFVLITTLYAIMVFYLSVSAGVGDIKHFLKMDLGYPIRNILLANDLSSVMDFLLASLHAVQEASIDPAHVGIYFGLGVLLYFVFLSSKRPAFARHSGICAVCIGTAYGVLNEVFQTLLPYRVASAADAFSNLIGLVLAQIFVILFALMLKAIFKVKKKELNAQ
jgi:VanZ family protein